MTKKMISIALAIVGAAAVATCGALEAYAQEGIAPSPPPLPGSIEYYPPPESSTYTSPSVGTYQFGSGGSTEPPHMLPPPQGGKYPPPVGETRSPEMMGLPTPQDTAPAGRPPEQGMKQNDEAYKREYSQKYERQYNEEVSHQTDMKMPEMQERYMRKGGEGEFRQQGQPFMKDGWDNPQGRPFMGEGNTQGRPFDGPPRGEASMGEFRMMGGGGEGGFKGPGEEEMEQMREEQEKRMQEEQLKQMKRGMVSGIERGLKQIRSMLTKLQKKGITVPSDVEVLVTEVASALEKLKAATKFNEEVEAAMETLQDKAQNLGEVGQRLGMLERLSQMEKQVGKEFAKVAKVVTKLKKSKAGSQFPEAVARVEGQLASLKGEWERIRTALQSGEGDDDVRETMDEFFEKFGDIHRGVELVRQLGSVSKLIKSAEKEVANTEKHIARLQKAGKDITRLNELLAQAKSKLAEIKSLAVGGTPDPEALFKAMQELQSIGEEAHNEMGRASGREETKQLHGAVMESVRALRMGR